MIDISFQSLTSPDDIVLREHFNYLANSTDRIVAKPNYGLAFHEIVDFGNNRKRNPNLAKPLYMWTHDPDTGNKWTQVRDPEPMDGVIIASREDLSIEPYDNIVKLADPGAYILASYGIVAGSLVEGVEKALTDKQNNKTNTYKVLGEVARKLRYQII